MHDGPVRYRLDQRQAAALFQLTGVVPDGRFAPDSLMQQERGRSRYSMPLCGLSRHPVAS